MEYVCPQTCPKGMRNGPCGGTLNGRCEVVDKPCIWVEVYSRAKSDGCIEDLRIYIPPRNKDLRGTSSWINYFLERDSRPRALTHGAGSGGDASAPKNAGSTNSRGAPASDSRSDGDRALIHIERK
jgi:hypothetical protein